MCVASQDTTSASNLMVQAGARTKVIGTTSMETVRISRVSIVFLETLPEVVEQEPKVVPEKGIVRAISILHQYE